MNSRRKHQHYLNAMGITAWQERYRSPEPSVESAVNIFALINQNQHTCGILLAELSEDFAQRATQLKLIQAMSAALRCQLQSVEGINTSLPVVIALGTEAQQLLQAQSFSERTRIVCADSAKVLLADPGKKAPLWQALKPLISLLGQC